MQKPLKRRRQKHAHKRGLQRFGLSVTSKENDEICKIIQRGGKCDCFLYRESNRITIRAVYYKNQWLPVVYDSVYKVIVTILPVNALSDFGFVGV